ncbi:thioesterase II family protein [Pseudomonas plecoglossicida]|uniref:Thioesterase n=1 Tax=Pseudomonas plecoglossicida TaxID=70775 RepID=A0AAD0QZS7_PSEDL|nr:alpha/beta fold hydrolase [Pseudomonas plecoglossicida]AXM95356.1 thioesterase [Pseudomonas plecoglossicida]QLB56104.1 thioesterase [Pseudomonas plecoglossicida]
MLTLFCLPHAGASAMGYARWRRSVPAWLDIRPLELPGRGSRLGEPLATDLVDLAAQLALELRGETRRAYALFGHSMGSLLAFELACALRALGLPPPQALLVSGGAAPAQRDYLRFRTPMSDEQLLGELARLQGTPDEALQDPELMRLALPVLHADFLLCGRYRYQPSAPLQCPLHVLAGSQDTASEAQLLAWRELAATEFSLKLFDAGHFFIQTQERAVLAHLAACLAPHAPAARPDSHFFAKV